MLGLHEYFSDAFFSEDDDESAPSSPLINGLDLHDVAHGDHGPSTNTQLQSPTIENRTLPPIDTSLEVSSPTDNTHEALAVPSIVVDNTQRVPRESDEQSTQAETVAESLKKQVHPEDAWTVSFISSQYMHDIGDAIDEDNSGFITQREANQFVTSKPFKYSLPVWIAYWAAGSYLLFERFSKFRD